MVLPRQDTSADSCREGDCTLCKHSRVSADKNTVQSLHDIHGSLHCIVSGSPFQKVFKQIERTHLFDEWFQFHQNYPESNVSAFVGADLYVSEHWTDFRRIELPS